MTASVFRRTVAPLFALLLVMSAPLLPAAQTKTTPPRQQAVQKSPATPGFTCPDPLSAKACNSFLELRQAGDEGVKASVSSDGIAYACFRQPEDEFFVLVLEGPVFAKAHFDPNQKKVVPDDDATDFRVGFLSAFVNGIEEPASIPIHRFSGEWNNQFFGLTFAAQSINGEKVSDTDSFGVSIVPSQVDAAFRYKNRLDTNIDYRLVIQRSTGRFSEKYKEESSKLPFSEKFGRCSRMPPT